MREEGVPVFRGGGLLTTVTTSKEQSSSLEAKSSSASQETLHILWNNVHKGLQLVSVLSTVGGFQIHIIKMFRNKKVERETCMQ
jgi:hypothetical protein